MKVVFKLTPDQLARAIEVVDLRYADKDPQEEVGRDREIDPNYRFWLGNLIGFLPWCSFEQNRNQFLDLEQDRVTYEGERHPLWQDGGMSVLYYIATGEGFPADIRPDDEYLYFRDSTWDTSSLVTLEVVKYVSSQPTWEWFETLDSHGGEEARMLAGIPGRTEEYAEAWHAVEESLKGSLDSAKKLLTVGFQLRDDRLGTLKSNLPPEEVEWARCENLLMGLELHRRDQELGRIRELSIQLGLLRSRAELIRGAIDVATYEHSLSCLPHKKE
jgi:hypothetical protein